MIKRAPFYGCLLWMLILLVMSLKTQAGDWQDTIQKVENDVDRVVLLRNIGNSYSSSNDSSLLYLNQALSLATDIGEKDLQCSILDKIGLLYDDLSDYTKAKDYYERSLTIKEELSDSGAIAHSYALMGNLHLWQSEFAPALTHFYKSIGIYERNDLIMEMSAVYNSTGIVMEMQQQWEEALFYYIKSMNIDKEKGYVKGLGVSYRNIGMLFSHLGKRDSTLHYYGMALIIDKQINDRWGTAVSHFNLAQYYGEVDNVSEAQPHIESAIALFEKMEAKDELISSYNLLAGFLNMSERHAEAVEILNKASQIALEINDKVTYYSAQKELSMAYAGMEKYKMAFRSHVKYTDVKDSVFNSDRTSQIAEMEVRYKTAEKEKQLVVKELTIEAEREKSSIQQLALIAAAVALLVLLGLAYSIATSLKAKKEANKLLTEQKLQIQEHQKDLTDSINYAKRIQDAILPPISKFEKYFEDAFVLYKPKDIVAGDFYWLESFASSSPLRFEDEASDSEGEAKGSEGEVKGPEGAGKDSESGGVVYYAAADCTGHGVPGAMVSVMCSNVLTRSVLEDGLSSTGAILDNCVDLLEGRFKDAKESIRDGMDVALVKVNRTKMTAEFSGANNSLWLIREGEIIEYKANRQPVGQYDYRVPFTTHEVALQKGDILYTFTDGFVDQFGGDNGKKYKSKPFKRLLLAMQDQSMEQQRELIDKAFENWRGALEQVDDVCVIGVRV